MGAVHPLLEEEQAAVLAADVEAIVDDLGVGQRFADGFDVGRGQVDRCQFDGLGVSALASPPRGGGGFSER